MSIEVRNATRAFGSFQALRGINISIPTGQFLALLGPSGSGKTTLLRIIAGLDRADEGTVFINGQDATAQGARGRNVGFVFQHYALFRHMSVFENVAFGMRVRPKSSRPTEAEIRARVNELLTLVQLDFLAHRLPSELSGGQRQRVALGSCAGGAAGRYYCSTSPLARSMRKCGRNCAAGCGGSMTRSA